MKKMNPVMAPQLLEAHTIYEEVLKTFLEIGPLDLSAGPLLLKNPFNGFRETLVLEVRDGKLLHHDLEKEEMQGDAFDFAQRCFGAANMRELAPLVRDMLCVRNLLHGPAKVDAGTGGAPVQVGVDIAEAPAKVAAGIGGAPAQVGADNGKATAQTGSGNGKATAQLENGKTVEGFPAHWPMDRVFIPQFSAFRAPVSNTTPCEVLDLATLYQRIRSPKYAAVTHQLRGIGDKKQRREFKARHFDYVTFGGIFSQRKDSALVLPSYLMVFDFDDLGDQLTHVWNLLCNDPEFTTRLLFTSPSGNGLKWVISYDPKVSTYPEYFTGVAHYLQVRYGLSPDPSGKDVSRACFLCHDPECFSAEK